MDPIMALDAMVLQDESIAHSFVLPNFMAPGEDYENGAGRRW